MRHAIAALLAVLVVVGTVGAGTALGAVQETGTNESVTNQTNASVAPGERLSGVVGVQGAEIDGEVESRSFGLAVARAESQEAKAALVAAKVNETKERLTTLSEQREQLREARANGSISQGEYRARITELAARTVNVERAAADTAKASAGLPAALLESKGVNATAIQTLREDAKNLSGGEVSDIARSIAGETAPGLADRDGDRGRNERPERNESADRDNRGQEQSGQADRPGDTDTADDGQETTAATTDDGATARADGNDRSGGVGSSSPSADGDAGDR